MSLFFTPCRNLSSILQPAPL